MRKELRDFLDAERSNSKTYIVGEIELYCESESCPVRSVDLEFKEIENKITKDLLCPVCRKILKIHSAKAH
jgi:hypothetical protein